MEKGTLKGAQMRAFYFLPQMILSTIFLFLTNIFIFSWVVFFGSFLCHTTQETTKEKNSSPKYSIKKNGKALNTNTFSS